MFCFNGCSFTFGEGFNTCDRTKYTYPYVVGKKTNTKVKNIAVKGSSNYLTFMRSASAIQSNMYDIVYTQWTMPTRLWLFPGPDTQFFTNDSKNTEYTYREIHLSVRAKRNLVNTLLMLNGEYQNLLELVDYCQILDSLAKVKNIKSYYINGLLHWTEDLFMNNDYSDMSNGFSKYTKNLLDFDNRDDTELKEFHYNLSNKLNTLNINNWVNIFESIDSNIIDTTPAKHHPGIKTNEWVADKIITHMGNNYGIN